MSRTILVAYGTKHGSTREVAEAVAATLEERDLTVETHPAAFVDDLSAYAGVVVGGAIYMGRLHPDAMHFLEQHRSRLADLPVAIFGMGPRTMEEQHADESRAQLMHALEKVPEVDPCAVAVFGGVRFPFNRLPSSDARDWSAIRAWAAEIAAAFGYGKPASEAGDPRSELQQTHR
jgi:menaquinone-dependent protoporphyrinogen oxidase